MLSVRNNSELFVIDHQLTAAQAAGHSAGRYGKGGDILYRWGNPAQYNRGTGANQQLFQQHHAHWIAANLPGAGHILIFNDGIGRGYSTVNEIVPPVDSAGNYNITAGAAFGPSTPIWTYVASPATNFYSAEISGAERLPNGNTLITEGMKTTSSGPSSMRLMNCRMMPISVFEVCITPLDSPVVPEVNNSWQTSLGSSSAPAEIGQSAPSSASSKE